MPEGFDGSPGGVEERQDEVEGFRLHALVNRGDVVLERKGHLNPVRLEGIKDREDLKTLIDGTLGRWRQRRASAVRP